jgi:hypothetical protein
VLHFRVGRKNISERVYPNLDAYFDDLGKTYRAHTSSPPPAGEGGERGEAA